MGNQENERKATGEHELNSKSSQDSTEINMQASADSVQAIKAELKQLPKVRKGFADLLEYPALTQYLKKSRKIGKFALWIMSLAPFIGFVSYSVLTGDMDIKEALWVGTIVSAIFMVFSISFAVKEKSRQGTWTGTIMDMKREKVVEKVTEFDETRWVKMEHYSMTIHRDDRSKPFLHKLGGNENVFNYYKVGDKVRHIAGAFHLEKYDKTGDGEIICVMCGGLYDIDTDNKCGFCRLPLLK
ncbi:MAG: hypothetical protein E4G74_01700 [Erysipelotrichales bacterium]|nr:MAG: hypothetical protein E4G74_01700 [Erysipelotrichales bacterium]